MIFYWIKKSKKRTGSERSTDMYSADSLDPTNRVKQYGAVPVRASPDAECMYC